MSWTLVVIAIGVALALAQLVILVRRVRARRSEDVWSAGAARESAHSRAKKAGATLAAGLIAGCGGCGCGG